MKNEDRIVELLSESLKRQDQMIGQLDKVEGALEQHTQILLNHGEALTSLVKSMNNLTDIVTKAMDDLKQLDKIKERLSRLEKHTGLE